MTHVSSREEFLATFSAFKNSVKGLCPRCQKTSMFRGMMKLKTQCEICGLDYSFARPADGPAFFVISIICLLAGGWTIFLTMKYDAPFWVHMITTGPLMLLGTIALLHFFRAWFVSAEYYIKVRDGRLRHDA